MLQKRILLFNNSLAHVGRQHGIAYQTLDQLIKRPLASSVTPTATEAADGAATDEEDDNYNDNEDDPHNSSH